MTSWTYLGLIVAICSSTYAQQNAHTSVAAELRECYTNPEYINRNNLPPATMPVLIDIIRKLENHPNINLDLRQLAVILLHTYRQDGIEYHQPETTAGVSVNVLPYSPTFHSFQRHRLLLTRIIPRTTQLLENDVLPAKLKCALHFMLSTTVDARLRGDESSCSQLSQYRALRNVRSAQNRRRSINDDVEILDPKLFDDGQYGQFKDYTPDEDVEVTSFGKSRSARQLVGDSQCPLHGGVVRTQWGAVSGGNLIAGIAAGSQSQQIPVLELAKGSVLNYNDVQSSVTAIYPATLAGDLAEAVLIQGINQRQSTITIGAAGGWNSTQAQRHFVLQSRTNLEMTDPEIRGGIDGFILGTRSDSFSSLKLSQVLDMYYSPRNGVFSTAMRACNRRELTQQYISDTTLASETYAFAAALDTNMLLSGTLTGGLDSLVSQAVTTFQSYAASNLNDLSCLTTESTARDYRLRTNLYIVVDSTWQYQTIYPAISYLLDVIEVNPFQSSVTLLNAFDGSVIVNTTFSMSDFHSEYTLAKHQSMLTGVNLETTLRNVVTLMHAELEREKTINYVGGNSSVLLFLLNSGNIQNNQQVWEQARILNETVPDLRILFATSTNQMDNLWSLVRNIHDDIMTIALTSDGRNQETVLAGVVDRISQTGRRVINPECGSTYTVTTLSGTKSFDDYLEPGYINFYSISPNYFYVSQTTRKIRITRTASGAGSLIICHSRSVTQPRQNSTLGLDENAVICQTLSTGNVEISLAGACDSAWTINSCPFFYFSIQSVTAGATTTTTTCSEAACRFPYDMRYQVSIEDFACFNSASGVSASLVIVLAGYLIHLLYFS